jgi:hypothetical protein
MKITKNVLKQIIKEEIQKAMEKSAFYEVPVQEVKELPKEVAAKLHGKELNAKFIETGEEEDTGEIEDTGILEIDATKDTKGNVIEDGYIIALKINKAWRGYKTKIIIQDPAKDKIYSSTIVKVGEPLRNWDNQYFGKIETIITLKEN